MEFDSDENVAMALKQGYDASEVMSVASSSHLGNSMQATPSALALPGAGAPSAPHPDSSGSVNFAPAVASRSTPPQQRDPHRDSPAPASILRTNSSSGMSASRASRQRSTSTGRGSPQAVPPAKAAPGLLTTPSSRVTTSGSTLSNANAVRGGGGGGLNVLSAPSLGGPTSFKRMSSFNASGGIDYRQMTLDSDEDFTGTRAMVHNVFSIHGGKIPHPLIVDPNSAKKELRASPDESMKTLKGHLGLASPPSHEKEKSPGKDQSPDATSLTAAPTLVIGVESQAGTSITGSDVLPSTVGSGTNPMLPSPNTAAKQKGGSRSARATTPSGNSLRHRIRSYTPTSSGRRVASRGRDGRVASPILTTSARLLKNEGRLKTQENIKRLKADKEKRRIRGEDDFKTSLREKAAAIEEKIEKKKRELPPPDRQNYSYDDVPANVHHRKKWDTSQYSYQKILVFDEPDTGFDDGGAAHSPLLGATPSPSRMLTGKSGTSTGYQKWRQEQQNAVPLTSKQHARGSYVGDAYAPGGGRGASAGSLLFSEDISLPPTQLSAAEATVGTQDGSNVGIGQHSSPAPRPSGGLGRPAALSGGAHPRGGSPLRVGMGTTSSIHCDLTPRQHDAFDVPPAVTEKLQYQAFKQEELRQQQSSLHPVGKNRVRKGNQNGGLEAPPQIVQGTMHIQQQPVSVTPPRQVVQSSHNTSSGSVPKREAVPIAQPEQPQQPSSALNQTNYSAQYYKEEMVKLGVGPRHHGGRSSGRPKFAVNLSQSGSGANTPLGSQSGDGTPKESPLGVLSSMEAEKRAAAQSNTPRLTVAAREKQHSLVSALSKDMSIVFGGSEGATTHYIQRGPMETPVGLILS